MNDIEITQDQLGRFWTSLTQRVCAGQQLGPSLVEIAQELSGTALAPVVEDIVVHVRDGEPLHVAMNRHTDVFRRHVLCFVEGGDRAGILDKALKLIVDAARDCPACILGLPDPTKILELSGTIDYDPDYDYKAERRRR
jgi:type II secretory pathway component PulF